VCTYTHTQTHTHTHTLMCVCVRALQDKKYWKERDWEALQHKRKLKMDEAVRLLNNRTEDEIELDALVNQPAVARIPVVNKLVVLGSQVL
jgi:hypothetical protein